MTPPSRSPDFDDVVDDDEETQVFDRIWALFRRVDEAEKSAYDVDDAWARLADRLDLEGEEGGRASSGEQRAPDRPSRPAPGGRFRRRTSALVLAVVLVGIIGAGVWWSQPVSVHTTPGEQTVVSLPDGSTAELNGGTTLSYSRGFTSVPWVGSVDRRVQFDGEAFFSVVEGERPFRVETTNARVKVLGTAFHVRARPAGQQSETRVVVASGRVQFASAADTAGSVVLEGEGASSAVRGSSTSPSAPHSVDLKYVEAWRTGGFALSRASLPTILRELERQFGMSLDLRVPAAETDTMTLHYARDAELEAVLRDICLIQNLSYRETSQGYELVRDEE
jgi:transmembrane sensor